jgi:DNA-binding winged helix-turn-helix (wHTH) protein
MRQMFGGCVFDRDRRELALRGTLVPCGPKVLALLELLLDAAPRALTKEEIHKAIWPDTFVTDATLTSLVGDLRSALGDEARTPRHIRTIHGYGYAFIGPVATARLEQRPSQALTVHVIVGDRDIMLAAGEHIIGRASDAAIFVNDGGVSRQHARITITGAEVVLEDLRSKNGTTLDGEPVQRSTPLSDGALIVVGATALRLRLFAPSLSTETLSRHTPRARDS